MTTTNLKSAIRTLDREPVIMGIVVMIFLLASLIAAAGRSEARVEQPMLPSIIVQTAAALPTPLPIVIVQVRYIVATPTAAPAPEPMAVLDAPPATAPTVDLPLTSSWPSDWRTRGQPTR